jgi:PAN domain
MRRFSRVFTAATAFSLLRTLLVSTLLVTAFASALLGPAAAQSKFFTFERGIDRPGLDFNNTPSQGAADCSFACQLENQCRAWTFVRPGVQGPSGRCFLKSAVPQARRDNCCTSGFRKGSPGTL